MEPWHPAHKDANGLEYLVVGERWKLNAARDSSLCGPVLCSGIRAEAAPCTSGSTQAGSCRPDPTSLDWGQDAPPPLLSPPPVHPCGVWSMPCPLKIRASPSSSLPPASCLRQGHVDPLGKADQVQAAYQALPHLPP